MRLSLVFLYIALSACLPHFLSNVARASDGDQVRAQEILAKYIDAETGLIKFYSQVSGNGSYREYKRLPSERLDPESEKKRDALGIAGYRDIGEELTKQIKGKFAFDGPKRMVEIHNLLIKRIDLTNPPKLSFKDVTDEPKSPTRLVYCVNSEKSFTLRWVNGTKSPNSKTYVDALEVEKQLPAFPRVGLTSPYNLQIGAKSFSEILKQKSFVAKNVKDVAVDGHNCVELNFDYMLDNKRTDVRSGKIIFSPEEGWVIKSYSLFLENGLPAAIGSVRYAERRGDSLPPIFQVTVEIPTTRWVYEFDSFVRGPAQDSDFAITSYDFNAGIPKRDQQDARQADQRRDR